MHTLWIPSWYPTHSDQLGGSFFREQATALSRDGMKVGVLVPRIIPVYGLWGSGLDLDPSLTDEDGIPVARIDILQVLPKARVITTSMVGSLMDRVVDHYIARYGKPDILHAHSLYPAGFFSRRLSQRLDVPWIYTEHRSLDHMPIRTGLGRLAETRVVRSASARVGVSKGHAAYLEKRFGVKAGNWECIANMLPTEARSGVRSRRSRDGEIIVGHLSMLSEVKRVDLVIRGFEKAFGLARNAHLRIAGPLDGPDGDAVRRLVSQSPVRDKIDLLGVIRREDIANFFADLDVFVLPSDSETFGVALLESLVSGTPVIATKTWGGEEIVREDDGILVDFDSPEQVAGALLEITAGTVDQHARLDRRDRCIARFGEATFGGEYRSLYERVLGL